MSDTEQTIKILAIESSCDETAAAVVVNGRDMRSNVISSQIALHTLYGGVVPEIASRKHIEKINQVIAQALSDADMTLQDMDAIGVTYGPGLVGALLVGVAEAKAISYAANIPLVGVHHIEGHISANYIENPDLKPKKHDEWKVEYMTLLMRDTEMMEKGRNDMLFSLVQDGTLSLEIAATKAEMPVEKFAKAMKEAGYFIRELP